MKRSDNKKTRRIAVVYGGRSVEHEISVITACLAKGYFDGELLSVYLDRDNRAYLVPNNLTPRDHVRKKFSDQVVFLTGEGALGVVRGRRIVKKIPVDVAVNCCHGLFGEDGCIAALCRMSGIPLVGSDVAASAVAMDKVLAKQVLSSCGFPVVNGVSLTEGEDATAKVRKLRYPLIVKPAMLGSSIGVGVCHSADELTNALSLAFSYCDKVLVEEALTDFFELNCAAMRVDGTVRTSAVERPVTVNELLTFADKYMSGGSCKARSGAVANNVARDSVGTQYDSSNAQCDSKNADKTTNGKSARVDIGVQRVNGEGQNGEPTAFETYCQEASRLTAEIYDKLFFGGVVRVDYLVDNKTGKLYVNEINTTPGSLAFGLWQAAYSRTSFGEVLVDQAIADYRQLQSHVYTFDSGVLNGGGGKKK